MRRRDVLVAAGSIAAPAVLPCAGIARARPAAPDLVMFDARYEAARRFAGALAASGSAVVETQTDVARLWYGVVRSGWVANRRIRMAGLTTWSDFVVIQGCAAEERRRLQWVAFHNPAQSHRVSRGDRRLEAVLTAAGGGWPETLATAVGASGRSRSRRRADSERVALVSWLLA